METGNKNKGFASMTPERRKLVASQGGQKRKLLAEQGKAPSFSVIGRIGGLKKPIKKYEKPT
jgi:hypothetical protein